MDIQMPAHPEMVTYPVYKENLGKKKRTMDTEQEKKESEKDEAWEKTIETMKAEEIQRNIDKAVAEKEKEQSHTSKLLEHHMKIQALERKVAYLQGELDGMEARRREQQKVLAIFFCGAIYGIALYLLFTL